MEGIIRRDFLIYMAGLGATAALPGLTSCAKYYGYATPSAVWVNDIQSKLNRTSVSKIISVDSEEAIKHAITLAKKNDEKICSAGGRHSMGGQQFASNEYLIDIRPYNRVLEFDRERGTVTTEAGIQWPELIDYLLKAQQGSERQWGIRQKQTGADTFTLSGTLSANAHGRGLTFKPIVSDTESIEIINADGETIICSREENKELFSLAIGGYGLFGIISKITLKLAPRTVLRRDVEVTTTNELMKKFEERISSGYLYGDFQFSTDENSEDFLYRGIFSCYKPVSSGARVPEDQKYLDPYDWSRLIHLAHGDKSKGFELYSQFYLSTNGQLYWSDTHQLSTYLENYHAAIDKTAGAKHPSSEMISEIYVPRPMLAKFLSRVREDFRKDGTNLIYGTIRVIERDDETFLPWASEPFVCTIFNLHTLHTYEGIAKSKRAFQKLIDRAIELGGSYFLTYHRWARKDQVLSCYPQFPEFLRHKQLYDPQDFFQSDWYRHYKIMFAPT